MVEGYRRCRARGSLATNAERPAWWIAQLTSRCLFPLAVSEVCRLWRLSAQGRMRAARVVGREVARELLPSLRHALVGIQVEVLVFHALPQPLDEHVVHPSSLLLSMLILMSSSLSTWVNSTLVNWLPWSVLKMAGVRYVVIGSSSASTQQSVVTNRHPMRQNVSGGPVQDRHQTDESAASWGCRSDREPRPDSDAQSSDS